MMTNYLFCRRGSLQGAFLWLLFSVVAVSVSYGQVRVPRMISDGMVLQRDMPLRIWGWASPGERVTVRFNGDKASGEADPTGRWAVLLSPKKAGGPYVMDIDGINHIWIKNIMVGDVWVCAGGSGMAMTMEKLSAKYAEEIASSDKYPIHFYNVPLRKDSSMPQDNFPPGTHWEAAGPTTVNKVSALGYLFARHLYDHYKVPIGLLDVAAAESLAEAWLSADGLRTFPEYASRTNYFNAMIAPLTSSTVRGILWYQGESNVGRAGEYENLFQGVILDWRRWWRQPNLPVVFVQLPGHGPVTTEPQQNSPWADLRAAQRAALKLPATGMAVAQDLNDANEGLDLDRKELVSRLFLSAESVAYDKKNMIFTGPVYSSLKVHGNRVTIHWDEVDRGLVIHGGGDLKGFEVAGEDHKFVPAKAQIEGKEVIVWGEGVEHPVAVRFAWGDNPGATGLYNRDVLFNEGLPAASFEGRAKIKVKPIKE